MKKGEIDEKIAFFAHRLSLTPDDHPDLLQLLTHLAILYMVRFGLYYDTGDLDKTIEYGSIALALTPDHHPVMVDLLFSQAAAYGERFQNLGQLDDINKAIEYARSCVTLTPEGDPHLPTYLGSLGITQAGRFERLGNLTDLEDAIESMSYALALSPENDPKLPMALNALGMSHGKRFERMGGLDDLDDSITYQSRGISLTLDDDQQLPQSLTNLGVSYRSRFLRLGELNDLERAIECVSRALELAPGNHPALPNILASLSALHSDLYNYMRQGGLSNLEKAIEYGYRAITVTPNGHPRLTFGLSNLGTFYAQRFDRLGEFNDLENAIKYQSRALALTPTGRQELPSIYSALTLSYRSRFEHLREPNDLETAIMYEARALDTISIDHPDAAVLQSKHAHTQLLSFLQTKDMSQVYAALSLYRLASKSLYAAPHEKFKNAQLWAKATSSRLFFDPDDCIEAYQTAIDLLPQVIWLGTTTNKRYQEVSTTGPLAADAASVAICLSKHNLALEWLEHTRCVVWNQHLMLRSPVDQLLSVNSHLATRLQIIATQLHSAGSESREARAVSGLVTAEQVAQEHRQLAKEYDNLLAQIRQLEGFEDFLRPKPASDLVRAARSGPVVVINCHDDRCDALIIRPGEHEVHHVALLDYSAHKAQQARTLMEASLRAKGVRQRGFKPCQQVEKEVSMASVLATLWHSIVKPILEFLGCMHDRPNEDMTHLTWCPTGPLSFLPLHAAGDYDQPLSRVFDYVVSSYTPTLTALLASTPGSLSTYCRVLAIGQAATPGHSPLPGTETEIACVRARTEGKARYSELLNHHATVSAVLDAMEQHDWVHLACHAHQNVMDPTQSGFFLHDGALDIAAINRRSFRGKGLAFLSACQTATGDAKLADEAVHLASGMLMAGYTSVIGTMWSVHDADAPLIADRVYAQLMKDRKLGNGEAGRALHNAVGSLRETVGEQRFERWGSEQLSYYISFIGSLRALNLIDIHPYLIKLYKPKAPVPSPTTSPSGSVTAPNTLTTLTRTISLPAVPKLSPSPPGTKNPLEISATNAQLIHRSILLSREQQFDLLVARLSMVMDFWSYFLLCSSTSATGFVLTTTLSAFGGGTSPAMQSLALGLGGEEKDVGKLFGALFMLSSISSTILSPMIFGSLYSLTDSCAQSDIHRR